MTTVPEILARHTHTASQANLTMTVPVADMLAILGELRLASEVVALDVAERTAVKAAADVTQRFYGTKQGHAEQGRADGRAAAAVLQHAAARDAWAATHGPATPLAAEISLLRRVADTALDLQDANVRLSRATTSGDTTKSGALTAAAQRHLDTTHPVLVRRAQEAQRAHDDALTDYRKRTR